MTYNYHLNFTNEKLRPWGWSVLLKSPRLICRSTRTPTRSDLLVVRAHVWPIQETKEEKMSPLPAAMVSMSEVLGFQCLFACFCLFTKTSPKWQESSFGLRYHFVRTNHVWVMVVSILVYIITCKFWKQPLYNEDFSLLCEREGTYREHEYSDGFSRVTKAACGRAQDGTQVYC